MGASSHLETLRTCNEALLAEGLVRADVSRKLSSLYNQRVDAGLVKVRRPRMTEEQRSHGVCKYYRACGGYQLPGCMQDAVERRNCYTDPKSKLPSSKLVDVRENKKQSGTDEWLPIVRSASKCQVPEEAEVVHNPRPNKKQVSKA